MTNGLESFIRRFLAASVEKDSAAFIDLMAPDFQAHVAGSPKNRQAFAQHMGVFTTAFSDLQVDVLDVITDRDKVVARTTWRGVHDGNFMGVPATGKRIEIDAYIVERLEDGKTVEHWSLFDQMAMMQQLGLIPPP